jgi:hypothetical protein
MTEVRERRRVRRAGVEKVINAMGGNITGERT